VVAIAEKAALIAAIQKRDAKARANKCALHSDQIKYFYCEPCEEAVCAVCVHAKHSDCRPKPVEVAAAAAKVRAAQSAELQIIAGPADAQSVAACADGPSAPAGLDTLIGADALRAKISEMQTGQTAAVGGCGRTAGGRGHCSRGSRPPSRCRLTVSFLCSCDECVRLRRAAFLLCAGAERHRRAGR